MATFILADNQELSRYAFETMIKQDTSNRVFSANNRKALTELLIANQDAVVVLDYKLFDFIDDNQLMIASERFSKAVWLLVSDELTKNFLNRVIYTSHAFSIVFKGSPLSEIHEALKAVVRHSRFVCQQAMEIILAKDNLNSDENRSVPLTVTEIDIVKLIAQGKTTKEIAVERNLSVHTVTTHRKNIFRKLEINTVYELTKYALRLGLIDPAEFYI